MVWQLRWEPWASRLLDGFFLFFGFWTLLCWTLALLGASFQTLVALCWLPCLPAAALLRRPRAAPSGASNTAPSTASTTAQIGAPNAAPSPVEHAVDAALEPRVLGVAAFLAGLVAAIHRITASYALFWALAVALLYAAHRAAATPAAKVAPPAAEIAPPERSKARPRDLSALFLLALCAVAVVVTLVAHRPDPDDSFYLNLVVTALDRPADPLLAHDGMFGERNLPPLEPWYLLKSYEPLVATLSSLTGFDPKALYYLVFPALFAILTVVAHQAALRDLGGGGLAVVGTAIVVLVLLAWGDVHRAFGNFSFVRLYQGKAAVVSFCVPAVVHYAARFSLARDVRGWLLLGLSQVAALGISGSAIVAVPTTALAFLAGWFFATRRPAALHGLGASLLALGFAAVIFIRMPLERGLAMSWADLAHLSNDSATGLAAVLGSGPRQACALFALLLAPLLAPPARRRVVIGYVLALLLLVMNPLVPAFAARIAHRLSWRIFWSVPFPLLLGFCGQRLAALRLGRPRFARLGRYLPATALAFALAAAFAALPGTATLSPHDGTRLGLPTLKVMPEHALAGALVARTRPRDLVLAPYAIAQWVTTYRHHPRLMAVRPNYFGPVAGEGESKVEERRRLVALVGGPAPKSPPALAAPAALAALAADIALIEHRGIDVIALDSHLPWRTSLAAGLSRLGCLPFAAPLSATYELWRCPHPWPLPE